MPVESRGRVRRTSAHTVEDVPAMRPLQLGEPLTPPDEPPGGKTWGSGQFGFASSTHAVNVDSMVLVGMVQAIGAINLPVLVVERTGGRVLWASDAWLTRFGWQTHAARYVASSTELGESPMPAPGDSWQRTRSDPPSRWHRGPDRPAPDRRHVARDRARTIRDRGSPMMRPTSRR